MEFAVTLESARGGTRRYPWMSLGCAAAYGAWIDAHWQQSGTGGYRRGWGFSRDIMTCIAGSARPRAAFHGPHAVGTPPAVTGPWAESRRELHATHRHPTHGGRTAVRNQRSEHVRFGRAKILTGTMACALGWKRTSSVRWAIRPPKGARKQGRHSPEPNPKGSITRVGPGVAGKRVA